MLSAKSPPDAGASIRSRRCRCRPTRIAGCALLTVVPSIQQHLAFCCRVDSVSGSPAGPWGRSVPGQETIPATRRCDGLPLPCFLLADLRGFDLVLRPVVHRHERKVGPPLSGVRRSRVRWTTYLLAPGRSAPWGLACGGRLHRPAGLAVPTCKRWGAAAARSRPQVSPSMSGGPEGPSWSHRVTPHRGIPARSAHGWTSGSIEPSASPKSSPKG